MTATATMTPIAALLADAREAIDAIHDAGEEVVQAIRAENAAIQARDEYEASFIAAKIGTVNPLGKATKDGPAVHSATSAKVACQEDETYRQLVQARHDAELEVIRAKAFYQQIELRAKLAVIAAGGAA